MNEGNPAAPSDGLNRAAGWIVAGMCALFTWHVLAWSMEFGKLSVPPDYDDSHSLVEGAVRSATLRAHGPGAAVQEYLTRMPHSFLHYYLAAGLFAGFGVDQRVPYWANGLLLLGVLLTFVRQLPPLPALQKLGFVAAFLGVPISFHLIHDFRSECTMAGFLFIACGAAVQWVWAEKSAGRWLALAAVFFALAFAVKPVMFPYVGGMLGLCSLLAVGVNWLHPRRKWTLLARQLALLWGISLLPFLCHFYLFREQILKYIWNVAFASDFYKLSASGGARWLFHWQGYSGVWHLSWVKTVFAAIAASGVLLGCIPHLRGYAPGKIGLSYAFLTAGSFLGIAINAVNQPFFGMTFQLLLLSTALLTLAHYYSRWEQPWIVAGITLLLGLYWLKATLTLSFLIPAALVIALGAGLCWLTRLPGKQWVGVLGSGMLALYCWKVTQIAPYQNYRDRTAAEAGPAGLVWRQEGPKQAYEILKPFWNPARPPLVWVSAYGWVDGNTIGWEAAKDGKGWKIYNRGELPIDPDKKFPTQAEIIIVPEAGITGELATPDLSEAAALPDRLRADPDFLLLAEIAASNGKKIQVFQRRISRQAADPASLGH